jgi:uncharacterized protein YjbI with pentapeptide repeats
LIFFLFPIKYLFLKIIPFKLKYMEPDLTRTEVIKLIAIAPKPLDLGGVNLQGVDLSYLNLKGADLCRANLKGACLVGARLHYTDFTGADLKGADLKKAVFFGTILTGTGIKEPKGWW